MKNLTIPRLYCPFVSKLNHSTEAIQNHTHSWIMDYDLCSRDNFKQFETKGYSNFTARFYPTANLDQLCIASDFIALLFIVDDQIDNQFAESSSEKEITLRRFIETFMMIINQKTVSAEVDKNPVFNALKDVWGRLLRISRDTWTSSFIKEIECIFVASIWEYNNSFKQLPGTEEYLEKRRYAGAANISLALIEPIEEIYIPGYIRNHVIIKDLEKTACDIICIANDLFSLSKEQLAGDQHNLPSILKNERNISLEEAILLSAEMHDAEVNRFITLSQQIPSFDKDKNKMLERYLKVLEYQIAGNMIWSENETDRYQFIY